MHTPQPEPDHNDWIDMTQAQREYPFSRRQFWTWISEKRFPIYRPTKKKVVMKRSEINAFLESTHEIIP